MLVLAMQFSRDECGDGCRLVATARADAVRGIGGQEGRERAVDAGQWPASSATPSKRNSDAPIAQVPVVPVTRREARGSGRICDDTNSQ